MTVGIASISRHHQAAVVWLSAAAAAAVEERRHEATLRDELRVTDRVNGWVEGVEIAARRQPA